VGLRQIDITPARKYRTYEPAVVLKYADGELCIFKRIAEKDLWFFRAADSSDTHSELILSSIIDRRKWKKAKISAEEKAQEYFIIHISH
jgi:hypothetical protein